MRDNNREKFCSPNAIQGRVLGAILLSLTLLSGCALFEEPVYNRYGKVIDTEEYIQTTDTEEPVAEEIKPAITETAAEISKEEIKPAITETAAEISKEEVKPAITETAAEISQEEIPAETVAVSIVEETETAESNQVGTGGYLIQLDGAHVLLVEETETAESNQVWTDGYSIQLYGAHDRVFSQIYIQQHQLESSAAIHELEHRGQPWFVVLYGNYHTLSEATEAHESLTATLTTHGSWIRSLNQNQPAILPIYSLQLMASRSKDAAEKLITHHNIASKGYIYETIHTGSPRYLVLYGEYQYTRDARNAITTLPKALQKLGPWVRTVNEK